MASPYDDGWLLSEPLELLAVEMQVNRAVSVGREPFRIVTNPRGGRFYIYTTNYPSVPEKRHGPFSSLNPKSVRFTARQVRLRYEEDPGVPQESWRIGVPRLGVLPAGRR